MSKQATLVPEDAKGEPPLGDLEQIEGEESTLGLREVTEGDAVRLIQVIARFGPASKQRPPAA
jgi:hypothetical protein